ncbi:MAG: hypothetical protein AAGB00_09140 [Planctomycetota bacterium]
MRVQSFPAEVTAELGVYVYRLIDPRNGETFYIGKGKGDRVFAHSRAAIGSTDEDASDKLDRIRQILNAGFEAAHVIHRHGMNDAAAFEVEGALIDAYPGLANIAGGHHNSDRGAMHAREILDRYQAEEADFVHRVLLINVNRTADESSLYDATRYAWKINPKKAKRAEAIAAVQQGLIIGVFVADEWLPATAENFPGREPMPGRYGFVGSEAPQGVRRVYLRKSLPDRYRKRGASNPIKYTYH